ncbi:MAG: phage holin family protein [Patescibacteria group bacterium]
MKNFIKSWFKSFIALLALVHFYKGFSITGSLSDTVVAALFLTIIITFIQPLLKMLLLPFNIITLGMVQWLYTGIHLLLVAYLLKPVTFSAFTYQPFNILGITIPGGDVNLLFSVIIGGIFFKFIQEIVTRLT